MSFKRPHTPTKSSTSVSYSPSPSSQSHPTKSIKSTSKSSTSNLLCTLPPTCNPPRNHPTYIANTKDLEAHYARYHAHVCESQGCGCVFPDARLLELHQTECHDPIAALRKDRGEKIFACHLTTCSRVFSSPKTRRLHLIDTHAYPKEYFFAVTNKGVGGLLKKWGDGVSLLRKEWKDRGGEDEGEEGMDDEPMNIGEGEPPHPGGTKADVKSTGNTDDDLDGLASELNSLSLVPPSIRFGRGGKSGGFSGNAASPPPPPPRSAPTTAVPKNQEQPVTTTANSPRGNHHPRARGGTRGRNYFPVATSTHTHTPANQMIPTQVLTARGAAKRGFVNVPRGGTPARRIVPRGRGRGFGP